MDQINELKRLIKSFAKDFQSTDVRRLHGIFLDFKGWSTEALEMMNDWLEDGEYNITLEEAIKRLQYYLSQMGIEYRS